MIVSDGFLSLLVACLDLYAMAICFFFCFFYCYSISFVLCIVLNEHVVCELSQ